MDLVMKRRQQRLQQEREMAALLGGGASNTTEDITATSVPSTPVPPTTSEKPVVSVESSVSSSVTSVGGASEVDSSLGTLSVTGGGEVEPTPVVEPLTQSKPSVLNDSYEDILSSYRIRRPRTSLISDSTSTPSSSVAPDPTPSSTISITAETERTLSPANTLSPTVDDKPAPLTNIDSSTSATPLETQNSLPSEVEEKSSIKSDSAESSTTVKEETLVPPPSSESTRAQSPPCSIRENPVPSANITASVLPDADEAFLSSVKIRRPRISVTSTPELPSTPTRTRTADSDTAKELEALLQRKPISILTEIQQRDILPKTDLSSGPSLSARVRSRSPSPAPETPVPIPAPVPATVPTDAVTPDESDENMAFLSSLKIRRPRLGVHTPEVAPSTPVITSAQRRNYDGGPTAEELEKALQRQTYIPQALKEEDIAPAVAATPVTPATPVRSYAAPLSSFTSTPTATPTVPTTPLPADVVYESSLAAIQRRRIETTLKYINTGTETYTKTTDSTTKSLEEYEIMLRQKELESDVKKLKKQLDDRLAAQDGTALLVSQAQSRNEELQSQIDEMTVRLQTYEHITPRLLSNTAPAKVSALPAPPPKLEQAYSAGDQVFAQFGKDWYTSSKVLDFDGESYTLSIGDTAERATMSKSKVFPTITKMIDDIRLAIKREAELNDRLPRMTEAYEAQIAGITKEIEEVTADIEDYKFFLGEDFCSTVDNNPENQATKSFQEETNTMLYLTKEVQALNEYAISRTKWYVGKSKDSGSGLLANLLDPLAAPQDLPPATKEEALRTSIFQFFDEKQNAAEIEDIVNHSCDYSRTKTNYNIIHTPNSISVFSGTDTLLEANIKDTLATSSRVTQQVALPTGLRARREENKPKPLDTARFRLTLNSWHSVGKPAMSEAPIYPYAILSNGDTSELGLDPAIPPEEYLTEPEFETVFGMRRSVFDTLPEYHKTFLRIQRKLVT
ncbi:hypothetical protein Pelo_6060 [Pelomyxa schiedti]|nr:hypothetical protein Pelo_6060 [Pelomyxa schiedti]